MSGPLNLAQVLSFLLDTPMFGDLDEHELSQIVHEMLIVHLREDQVLFREGDPGDAWYVVYEGSLDVQKDGRTLVVLGPRACVGEMAVLDGSARSATVRAEGEATVFKFTRTSFERMRQENELAVYKLAYHMARTLAARQRQTTEHLSARLAEGPAVAAEHILPIVEVTSPAE